MFWNIVYYLSVRLYVQQTQYISMMLFHELNSLLGQRKNRLGSYMWCLACLKGLTVENTPFLPPPVAVYSSANLMSAHKDAAVHKLGGPLHSSTGSSEPGGIHEA